MNNKEQKVNLTTKTMDVIEYMSYEKRSLSLQMIASGVGIPAATAHRILTALKESGYAEQRGNKDYYLTYKMFTVAGRIMESDRLIEEMLPFLNYFAMTTDCGISLTAFSDDACINLLSVGKNVKFRAPLVVPGTAHPCHCTAAGKLFLAYLTEEELNGWLSRNHLLPYTKNTIIDADVLREEVRKTRECGYGTMYGELADDIAVLSLPLQYSHGRVITALNFSIECEHFSQINNLEFIGKVKSMLAGYSLKKQ